MNLESSKVSVSKPAAYLFEALTDIKNFEKLMPENIAKFEVIDENCFEFGLKGMPEIKLVEKSATPNSEIILGAASSKLPFTLIAKLEEKSTEQTDVKQYLKRKNKQMKTMIDKSTIRKFIETLAQNMIHL